MDTGLHVASFLPPVFSSIIMCRHIFVEHCNWLDWFLVGWSDVLRSLSSTPLQDATGTLLSVVLITACRPSFLAQGNRPKPPCPQGDYAYTLLSLSA